MPAPAPAFWTGRLCVAVVASGAQMNAFAKPASPAATRNQMMSESGVINCANQATEIANRVKPMVGTTRGCSRPANLPTNGAITPVMIAIGANTSADSVGDISRTACR